jgi:hypothetical protein
MVLKGQKSIKNGSIRPKMAIMCGEEGLSVDVNGQKYVINIGRRVV